MKTYNAILTVYSSIRDRYGNVYWAAVLHDGAGRIYGQGTVCSDNFSWRDCEKQKWYRENIKLPIREFNRLTKNMGYAGCTWEEIKKALKKNYK